MGENNAARNRPNYIRRGTLKEANIKYKSNWDLCYSHLKLYLYIDLTGLYGNEDGSVPATFQLLFFIGWKPDPSHRGPVKRGSGSVSLGELKDVISERNELQK